MSEQGESVARGGYGGPYQELLLNAITGLQREVAGLRSDLAKQSEHVAAELREQDRLRSEAIGLVNVKLAVIETKVALYAGLGSVVGSIAISSLFEFLLRRGII